MAEIDGILIQTLRRLGCEISEDISSIKQFSTDMLVESVVSCLRAITPEKTYPSRLSASMTVKYKQASLISEACKGLGYPGELGYEAFLYGNEIEVRRLLTFLVDRLPKEESAPLSFGAPTYESIFLREIRESVQKESSRHWLPPALWAIRPETDLRHLKAFRSRRLEVPSSAERSSVPSLPQQCESTEELASSIIEMNSSVLSSSQALSKRMAFGDSNSAAARILEILKRVETSMSSRSAPTRQTGVKPPLPPRKPKLNDSKAPSESTSESHQQVEDTVPKEVSLEEQTSSFRSEIAKISESVVTVQTELTELRAAVSKAERTVMEGREFLDAYRKSSEEKRAISEALTGQDADPESLKADISQLEDSFGQMQEKWEETKVRLNSEVAAVRQKAMSSNTIERLQDEIRECRALASSLSAELTERVDYAEILNKEYKKLTTNNPPRNSYTKRILEILGNIKKQRLDIEKIIKDTRVIQKEINTLSGRLDRAFVETDELMFRNAKDDAFVKRAYKLVAAFHETCANLISTVEITGQIMRECRDLEDEVDTEGKRDVTVNIERLTKDLEAVRRENASLISTH